MTLRASKPAAGSVGLVETRYLDLPQPIALDCGRELHPIRRLGTPDDVALAALYLASDDASWVAGIIFDVAGGAVMV